MENIKYQSIRQRRSFDGPQELENTESWNRSDKRNDEMELVAYTITHHTRQSAIGLPFIREKEYSGQTYSVTEYTMSEIVASVYDCMERTGKKGGDTFYR